MSEQKTRTTADVTQEYNNLAFKAGNLQYQINELKRNLDAINDTMRSLSTEFVGLKAHEDKVAEAVADAKAKETPPAAEAAKEADASLETPPAAPAKRRGRPKKVEEAALAEPASGTTADGGAA